MPKQRITKEMVVDAAFELARQGGLEEVLVKNIAAKLGCSVQPIYSYCSSMEGLRKDVEERTVQFVREYLKENIDPNDLFHSTGYAYIKLAKEEANLYRIYFTYKREGIHSLEELYRKMTNPDMACYLAEKLQISEEKAKALHMNMLIYTQGMGTILAVTEPGISEEEAREQLLQAFDVFLLKAREDSYKKMEESKCH